MCRRAVALLPAVAGSGHDEGSVINEKISSLETPAWLKNWISSLRREFPAVMVIANLSRTRLAITVARALALEHFLVVDRPISFALSTIASSGVSKVTVGADFPVEGTVVPGAGLVLVEVIVD